jgi:hypothetical protein
VSFLTNSDAIFYASFNNVTKSFVNWRTTKGLKKKLLVSFISNPCISNKADLLYVNINCSVQNFFLPETQKLNMDRVAGQQLLYKV